MDSHPRRPSRLSGRRHSASGEASRLAEIERIWSMSALERMALALSLGRRREALMALRSPGRPGGSDD